jgi:hypothetical protein
VSSLFAVHDEFAHCGSSREPLAHVIAAESGRVSTDFTERPCILASLYLQKSCEYIRLLQLLSQRNTLLQYKPWQT